MKPNKLANNPHALDEEYFIRVDSSSSNSDSDASDEKSMSPSDYSTRSSLLSVYGNKSAPVIPQPIKGRSASGTFSLEDGTEKVKKSNKRNSLSKSTPVGLDPNQSSSPTSSGVLSPVKSVEATLSISQSSMPQAFSMASSSDLVPFVYKGDRDAILQRHCIPQGGAVLRGGEMALVTLPGGERGEQETSEALVGYVEDDDIGGDSSAVKEGKKNKKKNDDEEGEERNEGLGYVEEGSNYVGEDDSNEMSSDENQKEDKDEQAKVRATSPVLDDDDDEQAALSLVWTGPAGILEEWLINEHDTITKGDVIARVRTSEQLAHLIQADQFAQQQRSRRADWNESVNARFQGLTESLVKAIASGTRHAVFAPETLSCCNDLERVTRDFLDTARTYGKVIISEMHLPLEKKTIRPLKMGGVLGGSKYVVRDVLFKQGNGTLFADYPDPLYFANKIQGHELKGLKAYFGVFFNNGAIGTVSFPLMAIIDFKGHRVTAMSELPISGEETLIFGSCNAGTECNVRNVEPAWSKRIMEASTALGLKPHHVVNGRSSGGEIEIASCVDLEGHAGRDSRRYLLDFSRTFPPVHKPASQRKDYDKLWPFYHMFRSEFVLKHKAKLSPDAYSTFQSPLHPEEKQQNHLEIREATEILRTQTVANVCEALTQAVKSVDAISLSLAHVFHREGLNMRYLGLVYARLVSKNFSMSMKNTYKSIIAEALMRVLKNHVRFRLRQQSGESSQLNEARRVLNAFFGKSTSEHEWMQRNPFCMEDLMNRFNFTAQDARFAIVTFRTASTMDAAEGKNMLKISIKYVVLKRLSEATGLELDPELMRDLASDNGTIRGRSFDVVNIFEDLDFSFSERVKELDIVQRVFGLAQYLKGMQVINRAGMGAEQYLLRGFFMIEKALEASPLDPWLAMLMADICAALWSSFNSDCKVLEQVLAKGQGQVAEVKDLAEQKELANIFSKRAEKYYLETIKAAPLVAPQRNYALFLMQHGRMLEAEKCLNAALELCNSTGGTLSGEVLSEWELVEELMLLLKDCEDIRKHGGPQSSQSEGLAKSDFQVGGGVSLGVSSKKTGPMRRVSIDIRKGLGKISSSRRQSVAPSGSSSIGGSKSSDAPLSPNASDLRDSFHRPLTASFVSDDEETILSDNVRVAAERNKMLLARLKGKLE